MARDGATDGTRRLPRAMGIAVLLAAVTPLMSIGPAAADAALRYRAYLTANPRPGACFEHVGIYAGLQVQLARRIGRQELKRLAERNKPRRASARIGKRIYALRLDPTRSSYGNEQIGWSFAVVSLSGRRARALIGRRAAIRYTVGDKTHVTTPTSVRDGRCRSLI